MSTILKGIAASNGIAIAKAYRLVEPDLKVERKDIQNSEEEIKRFEEAIRQSQSELETIRDHAKKELGEEKAAIF